ncbi:hypothetical protein [Actinacidiphila sp. ITFR-21]|uniref:hypothetical protein n=1 Tax=Actinacidiphila sp. ITFR-21 TaxID=3075199 RepID=UPI0028893FD9|nr:hypothetical protein [Streptomyces sp. ITFR-21]WNI20130.1 hypothetical protein RLT57_31825 [Streptomyces sp. ITFR-21]
MDTTKLSTEDQHVWYLATLGREALLRQLALLDIPSSVTHDPLGLAYLVVRDLGVSRPDVRQATEAILRPLVGAATFSVALEVQGEPVEHAGIVPVIAERSAGSVTGQYAELMLFDLSGLMNRGAFRLSRLPAETHWIIDTSFHPSGAPDAERPFGSARGGRRRAVPSPAAAELNRLAGQAR